MSHGHLGYFGDFVRCSLFMANRLVHHWVIFRVRLPPSIVMCSMVGTVRLILGDFVRDGHLDVSLVLPLEVLHLGGVRIVRVNLVRSQLCIRMVLLEVPIGMLKGLCVSVVMIPYAVCVL